ncbi:MAG: hypothetical protein SFY81_01915 [Verrucomicrobiota bacterium]|nr:hypothetical protein [Verrucomicrobiota bacterium]
MEELVPFGSFTYFLMLGMLLFSRSMDFISTWIATPNLVLEANPLAKRLGWKWGILLNLLFCGAVPVWPLPAIMIATTSLLVAARNFQSAWLMRSMGEQAYRAWMAQQLSQISRNLFLTCLFAQTALYGLIGVALLYFSHMHLVPFAVGMGMITYAVAVTLYTLLSVWRIGRL